MTFDRRLSVRESFDGVAVDRRKAGDFHDVRTPDRLLDDIVVEQLSP